MKYGLVKNLDIHRIRLLRGEYYFFKREYDDFVVFNYNGVMLIFVLRHMLMYFRNFAFN
jgi:hypothetical protein